MKHKRDVPFFTIQKQRSHIETLDDCLFACLDVELSFLFSQPHNDVHLYLFLFQRSFFVSVPVE